MAECAKTVFVERFHDSFNLLKALGIIQCFVVQNTLDLVKHAQGVKLCVLDKAAEIFLAVEIPQSFPPNRIGKNSSKVESFILSPPDDYTRHLGNIQAI